MRSQTTCGLFLGLGKILNKQEEVFVYTKTLLAKDLSLRILNNIYDKTEKIELSLNLYIVSPSLDVYNVE